MTRAAKYHDIFENIKISDIFDVFAKIMGKNAKLKE